jgi:hypothetical protein
MTDQEAYQHVRERILKIYEKPRPLPMPIEFYWPIMDREHRRLWLKNHPEDLGRLKP